MVLIYGTFTAHSARHSAGFFASERPVSWHSFQQHDSLICCYAGIWSQQMQRQRMIEIQAADRTLNSDDFGTWQIAAMESGMPLTEVEAVAAVRMRFLGAAAVMDEVLGDRLTAEAVTEAAHQIHEVARTTAPLSLYWQDAGEDAPQSVPARRGKHR